MKAVLTSTESCADMYCDKITPYSESKEAHEFCLNCKAIGCSRGTCAMFRERFIDPYLRRAAGRSTRIIEYNGEKHTIAEWSEITGIPLETIYDRVKHGKKGKQLFAPQRG